MLNLRVMRALIKTQKRPSRRELILMVAVFGLLSFLSISALIIGVQKKTNRDLKKARYESELKVADLQKDLENIGKTLSGLKTKNEGAENEGGVQAPEPSNLIFIKTTEENRGYLSLSFCNPETGSACSFRGKDGKFVFILAHGYEDKDQFVRDMDFNTADGILLLNDFKVMMKSLQLN